MQSVKGNACLNCINCTKFGQLILRKIIKIIATRCRILRLKCTEFDLGWGSAPDPAGELTAFPQTLAGFKGKGGGKGIGKGRGEGWGGWGTGGEEGMETKGNK